MAASAEAAESGDPGEIFEILDERARHGLATIVKQRQAARAVIEADYPSSEKAPALAALGDAGSVTSPVALFAERCPSACLAQITETVGVPAAEVVRGDEIEVTTVRGHTLRMHAGHDRQYGLVWHHPEIAREVTQSSRELTQIRANAEVFKKRAALVP